VRNSFDHQDLEAHSVLGAKHVGVESWESAPQRRHGAQEGSPLGAGAAQSSALGTFQARNCACGSEGAARMQRLKSARHRSWTEERREWGGGRMHTAHGWAMDEDEQ
jgi:hypothetical protein